ncbi:MAG TPA: RraA family protein [Gammaproteobacteria bacterium]|nr:RraA family protein [Gammaproteobacteria bacterium]
MDNLLKKIREKNMVINSSTVSDVMDSMNLYGVLNHKLKRLSGNNKTIIGYAYTVDWKPVRKSSNIMSSQPSTWEQVKGFLVPEIDNGIGKIYVSGAGSLLTSAALAGGMSSTYFENLGFEGMVLGGATRDANELCKLDIPVVATNYIPTDTQGSYFVSDTGSYTTIEDIRIVTGDIIISDLTGTVCIPSKHARGILTRSMEIDLIENDMHGSLSNNLVHLIESNGRI